MRILGITYPLLTCYLSVTLPDHRAVERISQLLAREKRVPDSFNRQDRCIYGSNKILNTTSLETVPSK